MRHRHKVAYMIGCWSRAPLTQQAGHGPAHYQAGCLGKVPQMQSACGFGAGEAGAGGRQWVTWHRRKSFHMWVEPNVACMIGC
jgi:hypothetical protein